MNLYTFRFKSKQVITQAFIEANSLEKAEKLGKAYCDGDGGRRFIGVADAVLIREEVFNPNAGVAHMATVAEIATVKVETYPKGDIRNKGNG